LRPVSEALRRYLVNQFLRPSKINVLMGLMRLMADESDRIVLFEVEVVFSLNN